MPAKNTRVTRQRSVLTGILLALWCLLIGFAVISATNPPWLTRLSEGGIEVEAREARNAGDTLLRKGEVARAIGLYQYALEIHPTYIPAMVNLAVAYGRVGDPNRAERILRDVLDRDVEEPGVIWFNLGEILRRAGRHEEALEAYREAIGSSARQEMVWTRIGAVHLDRDAFDEAVASLEQALRIQQDPAASYFRMLCRARVAYRHEPEHLARLAALEAEWRQEKLDRFDLFTIQRSGTADSEVSRTLTLLGAAHGGAGESVRATERLQEALRLDPGNEEARRRLEEQRRQLQLN